MRSAIAVDPTRSQNSTVTSLRSPAIVPWMPRIFWARSFGMWRDSRSRRFSQASALKVDRGAAREELRQAFLVCGIEAQIGAVPGGAEDLHRAGGKLREIRVLILLLEDLRSDGVHQETPGDRSQRRRRHRRIAKPGGRRR